MEKECEVCGEVYDDKGYAKSTKCYKCWKTANPNYTPKKAPVQREVGTFKQPEPIKPKASKEEIERTFKECYDFVMTTIGTHSAFWEVEGGRQAVGSMINGLLIQRSK